jgi:hypothetical protein
MRSQMTAKRFSTATVMSNASAWRLSCALANPCLCVCSFLRIRGQPTASRRERPRTMRLKFSSESDSASEVLFKIRQCASSPAHQAHCRTAWHGCSGGRMVERRRCLMGGAPVPSPVGPRGARSTRTTHVPPRLMVDRLAVWVK